MRNSRESLSRISTDIEISLYLIKEELKSRKLFYILQEIGITECDFEPHLDSLILQTMGLSDEDDKIYSKYSDIMDKRSKRINADRDQMMKQAAKAYREILRLRKEDSKGNEP